MEDCRVNFVESPEEIKIGGVYKTSIQFYCYWNERFFDYDCDYYPSQRTLDKNETFMVLDKRIQSDTFNRLLVFSFDDNQKHVMVISKQMINMYRLINVI